MFKHLKLIISISLIILILAGGFISYFVIFKDRAAVAQVYSDGVLVKELPLNVDQTYEVRKNASQYNIIKVQGGKIWVEFGSCTGHSNRCDEHAKISKAGEIIVCAPNVMQIYLRKG